jgi:hypothetical protein
LDAWLLNRNNLRSQQLPAPRAPAKKGHHGHIGHHARDVHNLHRIRAAMRTPRQRLLRWIRFPPHVLCWIKV